MEGPIQEGFLEEGPEEECWNREPAAGWRPALKLRGKAWLAGELGRAGGKASRGRVAAFCSHSEPRAEPGCRGG